jgi:hypothetical protein
MLYTAPKEPLVCVEMGSAHKGSIALYAWRWDLLKKEASLCMTSFNSLHSFTVASHQVRLNEMRQTVDV